MKPVFISEIVQQLFPKICKSKSEARRLIRQKAVKIDGDLIVDEQAIIVRCSIDERNMLGLAILENSAREEFLKNGTGTIILEKDVVDGLENEDETILSISVGKKNRGIIRLNGDSYGKD